MFFISFLLPCLVSAVLIVPQPNGTYGVSLTDLQFTDTSRPDPYSGASQRKIPVSVLTPIGPRASCQSVEQPYLPGPTARFWEELLSSEYGISAKNTLTQIELSLCKATNATKDYPLILFSTRLGAPRHFYNIIASNIAAQGFTVVVVDTPGQARFITYLDGSTQNGINITEDPELSKAVDVRVKDVQFVLDSLSSKSYPLQLTGTLNTTAAAAYGHSLGGATALAVLGVDKRFIGGINLDGRFFGTALTNTYNVPFLLFARSDPPHNQNTDPTWAAVWPHLLGPKAQIVLKDSRHNTFTDLPIIASLFNLYKNPKTASVLGSISPQAALYTETTVMSTVAGFIFGQKSVSNVVDVAKTLTEIQVANATANGWQ